MALSGWLHLLAKPLGHTGKDDDFTPFNSIPEIVVAEEIYSRQQSGRSTELQDILLSVKSLSPMEVNNKIKLLEISGLIRAVSDAKNDDYYMLSGNGVAALESALERHRDAIAAWKEKCVRPRL